MPGWRRRLLIVIYWSFALMFRPDVVKIRLDSDAALLLDELLPVHDPSVQAGQALLLLPPDEGGDHAP
jgi:hypothetical protein